MLSSGVPFAKISPRRELVHFVAVATYRATLSVLDEQLETTQKGELPRANVIVTLISNTQSYIELILD